MGLKLAVCVTSADLSVTEGQLGSLWTNPIQSAFPARCRYWLNSRVASAAKEISPSPTFEQFIASVKEAASLQVARLTICESHDLIALLFTILKRQRAVSLPTLLCRPQEIHISVVFVVPFHSAELFVLISWSTLRTEAQDMQQEQEATGKSNASGLWIFGYGSLCWHPGFEFDKSLTGYVRGFSRRFWQGNTTHRGTEKKVSIHVFYFCACIPNVKHWNVNAS